MTNWTDPSDGGILDLANGVIVTETHWDNMRRDLARLGGTDGNTKTGSAKFSDNRISGSAPTNNLRCVELTIGAGAHLPLQISQVEGFLFISVTSDCGAIFYTRGGAGVVFEMSDPAGIWGTVSLASAHNVFWDGSLSSYRLQNNTSGSRTYSVWYTSTS